MERLMRGMDEEAAAGVALSDNACSDRVSDPQLPVHDVQPSLSGHGRSWRPSALKWDTACTVIAD